MSAITGFSAILRHEAATSQSASGQVRLTRSNSTPPLRILLADDHRMLREGLVGLLEAERDFSVVGEAENGRQAVEMARELKPDVIIMDLTMPIMSGLDATHAITREMPAIRVIGLSMHSHEDVADAMYEAGAVAFVTKGGPSDLLIDAIRNCRAHGDREV